MPIFIDPTTDFGFKKVFGEEQSQNVLKNFLSDILELPSRIEKISFLPSEQLPDSDPERKGILDLYCITEVGERFIVEMQNKRQRYFKDRAVYYSTFPIAKQVEKGSRWQYRLEPVYCIGVLGFSFTENGDYFSTVRLKNETTNEVFYEKLTFVFIELPNFDLSLSQLETPQQKWIYLFNHLPTFDEIPQEFTEDYLIEACEIAQFAALTARERDLYEQSLKIARDNYAIITTAEEDAHQQGDQQGFQRGIVHVATTMLKANQPIDIIAKYTGLSMDRIRQLAEKA